MILLLMKLRDPNINPDFLISKLREINGEMFDDQHYNIEVYWIGNLKGNNTDKYTQIWYNEQVVHMEKSLLSQQDVGRIFDEDAPIYLCTRSTIAHCAYMQSLLT
jgi:hypothetical protein